MNVERLTNNNIDIRAEKPEISIFEHKLICHFYFRLFLEVCMCERKKRSKLRAIFFFNNNKKFSS